MPITDVRLQAADYLKAYPGHAFCDACLADKLGLEVREVRNARIGLAGSHEFEQEQGFCSVCLDIRHVIHVAWLQFQTPNDDEHHAFEA